MYHKGNLVKRFPVLMLVILVIIVINGCFFIVDYRKNVLIREDLITKTDQNIWSTVESAIINSHACLVSDAKYLSKKIEAVILREYSSDLDKLKEEFDNKEFDKRLYDLFKSELQYDSVSQNQSFSDQPFTYILGFRQNLLAVFSNTNKDGLATSMTWKEYFSNSANSDLTDKLIDAIVNKNLSGNILLYQTGTFPNMSSIPNLNHDMETLKFIYNTYGLEGFKNFDFVNVSYITEYGDIFGSDDYLYLESVLNHKMIVVKTSNVYNTIIEELEPQIEQIRLNSDIVVSQISDNIARKSLEFITITLCLVMLIIFSSVIYNKSLDDK